MDGEWGLPEMVGAYHSLYPLEDLAAARDRPGQALGIPSQALKGVSAKDGQGYALRRLDSRQVHCMRSLTLPSPLFTLPCGVDSVRCCSLREHPAGKVPVHNKCKLRCLMGLGVEMVTQPSAVRVERSLMHAPLPCSWCPARRWWRRPRRWCRPGRRWARTPIWWCPGPRSSPPSWRGGPRWSSRTRTTPALSPWSRRTCCRARVRAAPFCMAALLHSAARRAAYCLAGDGLMAHAVPHQARLNCHAVHSKCI